jgi:hypothetical protein
VCPCVRALPYISVSLCSSRLLSVVGSPFVPWMKGCTRLTLTSRLVLGAATRSSRLYTSRQDCARSAKAVTPLLPTHRTTLHIVALQYGMEHRQCTIWAGELPGQGSNWGISTNTAQRHNLKAGNYVAADVLAGIDRKIDDGLPGSGRFQFSTYAGAGTPPVVGGTASGCTDADSAAGRWLERGGSDNCGAAILLR